MESTMSKPTVRSLAADINSCFKKGEDIFARGLLDETIELWRENWKLLCSQGRMYVLPKLFPSGDF